MDAIANQMIETFTHRQLVLVIQAGSALGLSPLTVAASLMQASASVLVQVSPKVASSILRAYADVIDAGPDDTPARAAAIAKFMAAGEAMLSVAKTARDFPQPQGRA